MDKLRIAYLNAESSGGIKFSNFEVRDKKILAHDNVVYYTLEDFACAFNNEEISDLGYIVIVNTK